MNKTVGVLGGGQLGRMLTEAASRLNIKVVTLDSANSPAKQINAVTNHITGSFKNADDVRRLAHACDVMTIEIEHVDTEILEELSAGFQTRENWKLVRGPKIEIHPSWETIRLIQDKYEQKTHLAGHGIRSPAFDPVDHDPAALRDMGNKLGFPFMLKSRTEAYDGRGNYPVRSVSDIDAALEALAGRPLYAEKWANFKMELAVMVVKTAQEASDEWESSTKAFPVVETVHEDSICKLVYAPARDVDQATIKDAQKMARAAVANLPGKGVFGVEIFLIKDGETKWIRQSVKELIFHLGSLMVNEIAPRPHNSGHYTIEACHISQYDAHLRAILDLPISQNSLNFANPSNNAIMFNILGGQDPESHLEVAKKALLLVDEAKIHLYGKGDARPGRKMGHVTLLANSMQLAQERMKPLVEAADKIRAQPRAPSSESGASKLAGSRKSPAPLVAITMGSESDRPVLIPGAKILEELGVPYEATITSAHRTPERMVSFAQGAASRGIKVIIAAAGGAAHLPGMIAANTRLPVIGIPVKASVLDGLDSLLSIAQMPRGCPVATVAINNSTNAAQLAARILANEDLHIRQKLEDYLANQTKGVERQAERMEALGIHNYSNDG